MPLFAAVWLPELPQSISNTLACLNKRRHIASCCVSIHTGRVKPVLNSLEVVASNNLIRMKITILYIESLFTTTKHNLI